MDVTDHIKAIVTGHPAVLFMKGTPEFPMCGYSSRAVAVLNAAGVQFHAVNVLADSEVRAGLPGYANCSTFPQLFIQGELIGGCDIVEDLHAAGELARMLSDTGSEDDA
ncbi:MAG TPA: Grx4 family monothiol glutaredoxin [Oleiagrimonas sp.]|nr:Grx4 family monothiol glutaredoxin [Oleiagrimonas sp.]